MTDTPPDGALPEWAWLALYRGAEPAPPAGAPPAEAWRALVRARKEKLAMMAASDRYRATGRWG